MLHGDQRNSLAFLLCYRVSVRLYPPIAELPRECDKMNIHKMNIHKICETHHQAVPYKPGIDLQRQAQTTNTFTDHSRCKCLHGLSSSPSCRTFYVQAGMLHSVAAQITLEHHLGRRSNDLRKHSHHCTVCCSSQDSCWHAGRIRHLHWRLLLMAPHKTSRQMHGTSTASTLLSWRESSTPGLLQMARRSRTLAATS